MFVIAVKNKKITELLEKKIIFKKPNFIDDFDFLRYKGRYPERLELTEEGILFLKACGGKDFIDCNCETLLRYISEKLQPSYSHVLYSGIKVLELKKDTEQFKIVRDYAYKNEYSLNHIVRFMSVYLTDLYLKEYEIK